MGCSPHCPVGGFAGGIFRQTFHRRFVSPGWFQAGFRYARRCHLVVNHQYAFLVQDVPSRSAFSTKVTRTPPGGVFRMSIAPP